MIYVMGDIHGEYEAYKEMLKKINFSEDDELYVLGDCIDRGPEPIKLLLDMMLRYNVYPIRGNHEYMAQEVLTQLNQEITADNIESVITLTLMKELELWDKNGGGVTRKQFAKLDKDNREGVLDYLKEFALYEKVEVNGREFVLVHGGLMNFDKNRPLDDYEEFEVIFEAPDYDKVYFEDKYLVTGHMPTISHEGNKGEVIMKNNHIAIDCGKVFGGRLACVRLDDLEVFYV